MIVLDTTVLVYAVGTGHALREPCRRLVAAVAAQEIGATTSVEVIQEFVHVWTRRRPRADAAALGRQYADLLAPLLPVSTADLKAGLILFSSIDGLGAFDAVLAAASEGLGARALVSADRAFASVPGLTHVVPDSDGVSSLLDA